MLPPASATATVLPAAQSIDVRFDDFMADEIAMVQRSTRRGQPFDAGVPAAMTAFMAEHPQGRHGRSTTTSLSSASTPTNVATPFAPTPTASGSDRRTTHERRTNIRRTPRSVVRDGLQAGAVGAVAVDLTREVQRSSVGHRLRACRRR